MLFIQSNLNPLVSALPSIKGYAVILSLLLIMGATQAGVIERDQARRIHERLTGIPPTNAVLDTMESLILDPSAGEEAAAMEAIKNPAFYNVTLKNYAAPWTNEAQSVFVPLNDYTATVIGMIRDDVDFREVLYGDIIYVGNNTPVYSNANNDHYEALELLGSDLSDNSVLLRKTQTEVTNIAAGGAAGVISTRAAGEAFFKDGTNRAMFRFTFINHMCSDLESLKDVSRVPDRVRQDASRSPGGDSRIFMFNCVGCHAGMDGLLGAYAYYNFSGDSLDYTPGVVTDKYLNNSNNFKPGYITTDDSWVNYWRNGQNKLLGWSSASTLPAGVQLDERQHAVGSGAQSMGAELANSKAFASCQVKKAFQAICLHDPQDYAVDRQKVDDIAIDFMSNGYSMKSVFAKVAAYCSQTAP